MNNESKQNVELSSKPIEPEDLLNRSPVSLMPKLIDGKLSDSIVCVTGAERPP